MATTISAGTLRLLFALIGYRAKARKNCGGSRQWFRAARHAPFRWTDPPGGGGRADLVQVETLTPHQVRRVCTADTLSALASDPHTEGADPAGLAWSARCCTIIYLIIIGRLCRPIQRSAWRRRYIGSLCGCCIVCAGMGQINGNAPVKPCTLFYEVGGITTHGRNKTHCKRLYWAILQQGKTKALHPQQMQGKRKARPFLTG